MATTAELQYLASVIHEVAQPKVRSQLSDNRNAITLPPNCDETSSQLCLIPNRQLPIQGVTIAVILCKRSREAAILKSDTNNLLPVCMSAWVCTRSILSIIRRIARVQQMVS